MAMLGFLKRNSAECTDPYTLITLFNSLVRTHLEYCCIVWNPIYTSHSIRLEKVQRNFTRYVFFKLGWNMERPYYTAHLFIYIR